MLSSNIFCEQKPEFYNLECPLYHIYLRTTLFISLIQNWVNSKLFFKLTLPNKLVICLFRQWNEYIHYWNVVYSVTGIMVEITPDVLTAPRGTTRLCQWTFRCVRMPVKCTDSWTHTTLCRRRWPLHASTYRTSTHRRLLPTLWGPSRITERTGMDTIKVWSKVRVFQLYIQFPSLDYAVILCMCLSHWKQLWSWLRHYGHAPV